MHTYRQCYQVSKKRHNFQSHFLLFYNLKNINEIINIQMNYKKIQFFQMNRNYLDKTLCSLLHVKMFNQSETICLLKQCSTLAFITTTNSIYERKLTLIVVKFNVLPFISKLYEQTLIYKTFRRWSALFNYVYQVRRNNSMFHLYSSAEKK